MLTPLDDYLVHQTSDTVDRVFTSDRNFYDRYYFNAHTIDGSAFLVVAMGLYPNIGVIDAFATIVLDDKTQHIVRASRALGSDRMATNAGPIGVEVIEGLRRFRVYAEPNEHGLEFDLTFTGATFPYEEPHFYRRAGNRVVMDYTRLTQCGRWEGIINVAGRRFDVDAKSWRGARDHSWGIRPVGGGEPQSAPAPDAGANGFFWVWTPMQFENGAIMFTCSEDATGDRWHAASELLPAYSIEAAPEPLRVIGHEINLRAGSRTFAGATLNVERADGTAATITCEPKTTIYMAGAGYAYLGGWRHGQYHGALAVEGEVWDLTDPALLPKISGQTETVCDFHAEGLGNLGDGHGILEFLLLGAYEPYGFKSWTDVAPAK